MRDLAEPKTTTTTKGSGAEGGKCEIRNPLPHRNPLSFLVLYFSKRVLFFSPFLGRSFAKKTRGPPPPLTKMHMRKKEKKKKSCGQISFLCFVLYYKSIYYVPASGSVDYCNFSFRFSPFFRPDDARRVCVFRHVSIV